MRVCVELGLLFLVGDSGSNGKSYKHIFIDIYYTCDWIVAIVLLSLSLFCTSNLGGLVLIQCVHVLCVFIQD